MCIGSRPVTAGLGAATAVQPADLASIRRYLQIGTDTRHCSSHEGRGDADKVQLRHVVQKVVQIDPTLSVGVDVCGRWVPIAEGFQRNEAEMSDVTQVF